MKFTFRASVNMFLNDNLDFLSYFSVLLDSWDCICVKSVYRLQFLICCDWLMNDMLQLNRNMRTWNNLRKKRFQRDTKFPHRWKKIKIHISSTDECYTNTFLHKNLSFIRTNKSFEATNFAALSQSCRNWFHLKIFSLKAVDFFYISDNS